MFQAQQKQFRLTAQLGFILLAVVVVSFVLIKLPYLPLPYYWDEAWVYAPAVQEMAAAGPSLAPDAIPAELTRGHPLLFHFLASGWISIFGNTPTSAHAFALLISVFVLLAVYRITSQLFTVPAALGAVILVSVQPLFFAQSGLLLPEVLLALFMLLALYAYISQNWTIYFFTAAAAILTKESAIALFAALSAHRLLIWMRQRSGGKQHILTLLKINAPLLAGIAFLLWQYAVRGWAFFPYHLELIKFEPAFIGDQLVRYFNYVFIYQGRNVITGILLVLVLIILFSKVNYSTQQRLWLSATGIFILVFLLMSAVNFYSSRYVVLLVILLCINTAGLLSLLPFNRWISALLLTGAIASPLVQLITFPGKNDHERGYADAVKVMQQGAQWLTRDEHITEYVFTPFLISKLLTDEKAGYVTAERRHKHVVSDVDKARFIVWSSIEDDPELKARLNDAQHFLLVQEFHSGTAQLKIYQNQQYK